MAAAGPQAAKRSDEPGVLDGEANRPAFDVPRDVRKFRVMVIVSVLAHVGLFAALFFATVPGPRVPIENKAIQTKLVRLGQDKKDWLPRMETPPPPPKAAPAVITPTKEVVVDKKPAPAKEEKKSSFEDSLKRLEAMERKADDYKGKGDPKGSKAGTVSDFTKQMIGLQWVSDAEQRIRQFYSAPSVIPEAERKALKVTVTLYVASNGKVLKKDIQASSGNELFDKAVLRAIEQSSPLPVPPPELREQVQGDGVDIEFLGRTL